jgi:hypothetical protein
VSYALSLLNLGTTGINLTSKAFAAPGIYNLKVSADALTGCPSSARSVSVNVNLTLPLTLLSFSGNYQNNTSHFDWSTTNEINTDFFELEKSVDGSGFTAVGRIPFVDHNKATETFEYMLAEALLKPTYFRLKIIDKNGSAQYSKTIMLKPDADKTNTVSVSPNPFTDQVTIYYTSSARSEITGVITNTAGNTVNKFQMAIAKGVNVLAVPQLSRLPAGLYFLSIQDTQTGVRTIQKIQKTN